MDGVSEMKIYLDSSHKKKDFHHSNVELLCTKKELDVMITLLLRFQQKIDWYIEKNRGKTDLGITHMHYQDDNVLWKEGDADIVFYVDLNRQD